MHRVSIGFSGTLEYFSALFQFSLFVVVFLLSFLSVSNWGSESDETQSYHNGNSEPRGFGKDGFIGLKIKGEDGLKKCFLPAEMQYILNV